MTTPLHERLGVRWLQQQPEWPTREGFRLARGTRWGWENKELCVWRYVDDWYNADPETRCEQTAHALIELAGVRALWREVGVSVGRYDGVCYCITSRGNSYQGADSLDAILAAVEAVLVPEGWTP